MSKHAGEQKCLWANMPVSKLSRANLPEQTCRWANFPEQNFLSKTSWAIMPVSKNASEQTFLSKPSWANLILSKSAWAKAWYPNKMILCQQNQCRMWVKMQFWVIYHTLNYRLLQKKVKYALFKYFCFKNFLLFVTFLFF